jgi:hypothetical protein
MSWLLGLLPDLLQWAPHILGGGGILAAVTGFVPNLRTYAMAGLAILLAAAVGYGLLERGNYQAEKAGRVADAATAQAVALKMVAAAKADSDQTIADLQNLLEVRANTKTVTVDRINNALSSNAPPSAAAVDASRFLRTITSSRPAGGPTTQRSPAAGVP